MFANVVCFKLIACVIAISFSQVACSLELLPKSTTVVIEDVAEKVKAAADGVEKAAGGFRDFLPFIAVILVVQTLVGILNLVARWRIMRSVVELNFRLRSRRPTKGREARRKLS